MDLSLLLLFTPMIPPTGPPCVPVGDVPRPAVCGVGPGAVICPGVLVPAEPPALTPGDPPREVPGCVDPPGVFAPGACAVTITSWKSSPVIGSLYFLRRNFCCTSTSMLGGWVL